VEMLENLRFFYLDLNRLIIEYDTPIQYETKAILTFPMATSGGGLRGITSDGQFLYVCHLEESILVYNLEGKKVETKSSIRWEQPSDIHLYKNNLYIVDLKQVAICNLEFQLLSSFPISHPAWSMKPDDDFIYLTQRGKNQVYIYTKDGKQTRSLGSAGRSAKPGEFREARGLTLDNTNLYVCDTWNHRVQVISKKDYTFSKQWGFYGRKPKQFIRPAGICYWEDILYVGDIWSVQLFDCDGTFLQRLGEDVEQCDCAWGLCVVNDRLYVCDAAKFRIQAYKTKDGYSK